MCVCVLWLVGRVCMNRWSSRSHFLSRADLELQRRRAAEPHSDPQSSSARDRSEMRAASAVIVLLSVAPVSAVPPFYDPQYCYFLDGILMLYGIVITAFFVRERFLKKRGKADEESPYQAINTGGKEVYSEPKRSAEGGRRRGDDTYTPLSRKTDDTYREIEPRGDRRRDQVYQGLSSVTKDTYDSLHMQQIHPPPR